jgi:hypothetical protein
MAGLSTGLFWLAWRLTAAASGSSVMLFAVTPLKKKLVLVLYLLVKINWNSLL